MRRAWKYILIIAALAFAVFGVHRWASSFWAATLMGPYTGVVYAAPIETQPVSILPIPGVGQLEVHEVPGENVPVLALRGSGRSMRWAQLLRPERRNEDGSVSMAFVCDLRLRGFERDSTGYRVRLKCFWEWGGQEGGLIFLNPDYSFRAFALSW